MLDPSVIDPQAFDLRILFTAGGSIVGAGIIAAVIQVLKRVPTFGSWLDADHEAFVAVVLAAILIVAAFAALNPAITAVSLAMAFLAWVNLAAAATKAYDVSPAGVKKALAGQ